MIEKTAWDVRKYPEKFAVYRILCNFAVVFQNCINSMEAKYIHRGAIRRDRRGLPLFFSSLR